MNHIPLLLIFAVLITTISIPAYGEVITDHIVINEVDTNPFGDDSLAVSEWVELYNPTDSDVDLSGWEIASTTVLKKTFTIPDGTIISPEKHLTFTYTKVWFTDSSELVELRNPSGDIVDKTPLISDLKNDFMSWQRSYDGHTDWEFSLGNAGGSNGKLISPEDSSAVEVTLSSDKTNYNFDDTAIIQGTVSEKVFVEVPTFQTAPILINISGPNFEQAISLYPDLNLNFETTLDLVQVLGISEGTYDVNVIYAGATNSISFTLDNERDTQNIIDTASSLSISTNNLEYFPGELVLINAFSNNVIPFESLVFTISDSENKLIAKGNLFTSDGDFDTELLLNTVNPNFGVYTISAEYGDDLATSSFTVLNPDLEIIDVGEVHSDSMILTTDDTEYLLNNYMIISGYLTNFEKERSLYAEQIKITFKDSDGNSPTFTSAIMDSSAGSKKIDFTSTAILDESGKFSVKLRLPYNTFFEGNYAVRADYGSLTGYASFSIVSDSSNLKNVPSDPDVPVGNPNMSIPGKPVDNTKFENGYFVSNVKTMIEKVNRISADLISITTEEKILNEQIVKPRVLSGSMVTVSKDVQSIVNLRVSSESGMCVIGTSSDCLVSESTRKPGQIFDVVNVDGMTLNVRYSGPDVRLEKFSILPQSSEDFLPDTNWNVEVLKDDEVSRFYYKVTYKTTQ